jgi:transposase-like protein
MKVVRMNLSTQSCPKRENAGKQIKSAESCCGTQRYLCRECGKTSTLEPKKQDYSEEVREKVACLYVEDNNFRCIGRLLNVNHQSL